MPIVRLLPELQVAGPSQMALDEVLLESAQAGTPSLRFYTWPTATLSLGYFQSATERFSDPLLAELPYVRRASGGGAIVHDREVTYALALPAGADWQPREESWLCRMHYRIQAALEDLGVRVGICACGQERWLGRFLCFEHQTPGDLLLDEHKIMGSAQRRRGGALLQHGSLLLAQSPHTPSLPGIRERTGIELDPAAVGPAVTRQLTDQLGWQFEPGPLNAFERNRAQEIEAEKYANSRWTEKR